jgi:hypothetical protein
MKELHCNEFTVLRQSVTEILAVFDTLIEKKALT